MKCYVRFSIFSATYSLIERDGEIAGDDRYLGGAVSTSSVVCDEGWSSGVLSF